MDMFPISNILSTQYEIPIVKAVLEREDALASSKPIKTTAQVLALISDRIVNDARESAWCVYCDGDFRPVYVVKVADGDVDRVCISIRTIVQCAMLTNAEHIYLIHNHPSGPVVPSKEDIYLSKRINRVCSELNVYLSDFLITGICLETRTQAIYSLAEKKKYKRINNPHDLNKVIEHELIMDALQLNKRPETSSNGEPLNGSSDCLQ